MADKSGIEWTEATWNPATGCVKVSPGCKFCYAKHKAWPRLSKNPKTVYFGRKFEDVQVHPERLSQPIRWTRPRMIFVNSMSDLFHEEIPFEFIDRVFLVMCCTTRHIYQVLTKRPERMLEYFNSRTSIRGGTPDQISAQWVLPAHGERVIVPVDWVVVGGESGPQARPMDVSLALDLLHQCRGGGVPFFMKQGSQANWPKYHDFNSFPPELRVREYPVY